jgi:hypothetical protein
MFLILIAIGWLYVALLMAVAEATSPIGTALGAIITFLLYGVGPVALLLYILGTPARKKMRQQREAEEVATLSVRAELVEAGSDSGLHTPSTGSGRTGLGSAQPDAGSQAAADAVAPVRKEP